MMPGQPKDAANDADRAAADVIAPRSSGVPQLCEPSLLNLKGSFRWSSSAFILLIRGKRRPSDAGGWVAGGESPGSLVRRESERSSRSSVTTLTTETPREARHSSMGRDFSPANSVREEPEEGSMSHRATESTETDTEKSPGQDL